MDKLKGSKTEKNLMEAFAGESMARNKYTYYASKAKKDGYVQIAALFEETANNEKEHAKIWFKLLHDGIGSTEANLKDAAEGENYEWTDMYAALQKTRVRKGSTISPTSSKWSVPSRKNTRNATANCCPTLKKDLFSRKTATASGSAATAATSSWARKRPTYAPSVHILKATSKYVLRTIDRTSWFMTFHQPVGPKRPTGCFVSPTLYV